jgi:hypothetical protein
MGAHHQQAITQWERALRTEVDAEHEADPLAELKSLRHEMVKELQQKMGYCIIKRTRDSEMPDGSKISDVPTKRIIPFLVALQEWEYAQLEGRFGLTSTESAQLRRICTGESAIEVRMEVG